MMTSSPTAGSVSAAADEGSRMVAEGLGKGLAGGRGAKVGMPVLLKDRPMTVNDREGSMARMPAVTSGSCAMAAENVPGVGAGGSL